MIKIIKKDITTINGPAIMGHGTNCLGYMSAGVALAIARKFPDVYEQYRKHVGPKRNPTLLGSVQFVPTTNNIVIANCFTQIDTGFDKFGNPPATLTAVENSLRRCVVAANDLGYDLYTPQIGCGLGGLDWEPDVREIYEKLSESLTTNWYVCIL